MNFDPAAGRTLERVNIDAWLTIYAELALSRRMRRYSRNEQEPEEQVCFPRPPFCSIHEDLVTHRLALSQRFRSYWLLLVVEAVLVPCFFVFVIVMVSSGVCPAGFDAAGFAIVNVSGLPCMSFTSIGI